MSNKKEDVQVAGNLQVTGDRANLLGLDGAGNFWITVGAGPEPGCAALGFNLGDKAVIINAGWSLSGPTITAIIEDLNFLSGELFHLQGVSDEARTRLKAMSNRYSALLKTAKPQG